MKDAKLSVRINEADKKCLEELAMERDIPVSQLIREFIKQGLKEARNDNIS